MLLFGRSRNHLEVLGADFLPFEKQLFLVITDADLNIQVLQYDPDSTFALFHTHIPHID